MAIGRIFTSLWVLEPEPPTNARLWPEDERLIEEFHVQGAVHKERNRCVFHFVLEADHPVQSKIDVRYPFVRDEDPIVVVLQFVSVIEPIGLGTHLATETVVPYQTGCFGDVLVDEVVELDPNRY